MSNDVTSTEIVIASLMVIAVGYLLAGSMGLLIAGVIVLFFGRRLGNVALSITNMR